MANFITLGAEINPDPEALLAVGQLPFDKVTVRFGEEQVQLRPGDTFLVPNMLGDTTIAILDADEQELASFDAGFSGTPTIWANIAADDGTCTRASFHKLG